MTVPWSLLWILGLICSSDSSCSPTSYYKSCWIRRYPGLYVDIEESQRRGAHILKLYHEESAVKCSRACCLTRNFSCNLAVFHFNTTQDSVNCFHLQCPNLESCIPHHRGNVILYNVTKGVDPDLLVFGKYFTTNVRVLPHMSSSRLNVSEPLTSDKRQFNYPPNPPVRSISPASTSTKKPTTPQQTTRAVPTAHQVQNTLPRCTTIQATTAQSTLEHVISTTSEPKTDSTLNPQLTTTTSHWASINLRHTTTSPTGEPDTTTDTLNQRIPTPPPVYITTAHPSSTTDYFDSTMTSVPINKALSSSTTQQTLELKTTAIQTPDSLAMASQKSMQSPGSSTTLRLKTTASKNTNSLAMGSQDTMQSSSSSTTQQSLGLQTSTLQTTNSLASQKSMKSFTKVLTSTQQPLNQTLEEYPKTTVQTTVIETVTAQTYAPFQSEASTTTKPLISANVPLQTLTQITAAYETIQAKTAQSTSETKMGSTPNPQQTTTTSKWTTIDPLTSTDVPLQTSTQTTPAYETSKWPLQTPTQTTTLSQPTQTTSSDTRTTTNPTVTTDGSTAPRYLSLSFTHTRLSNSPTTSSLSSSLTAPTSSMVDSQPYPNDTKGYISRNITTGDAPQPGGDGNLMSVWHLAANTVLVALATCATITFCCCCSVFVALSWRGRRRRKGRYRTNLRCKRGSMRLIKYVIVRESS
uniref:MANSC domain-containing protein n=1 Tax=Cyprinus carpio carpio TaxID=630221 RepID=A0A9J7ZYD3_CYPCA